MKEKKWVITKKEHKSIKNGVLTVITEEFEKKPQISKDILDYIIKGITTLSIFIPLVLLYIQYNYSITKKRNDDLSKILVNVSLDIETIKHSPPSSKKYITANENLLYQYRPQIATFKIDSLNKYYTLLLKPVAYNSVLTKCLAYISDSYKHYNQAYSDLIISHNNKNAHSISFSDSRTDKVKQLDSLTTILLNIPSVSHFKIAQYHFDEKSDSAQNNILAITSHNDEILGYLAHSSSQLSDYLKSYNPNPEVLENILIDRPYDKKNISEIIHSYGQLQALKQTIFYDLEKSRALFEQRTLALIHN